MSPLRSPKVVASFLGRLLLVFVIAEGACATLSVGYSVMTTVRESPRLHTRHDPLLGWVSTPNLSLPGHYGPGADFHTNSRGFRGEREVTGAASGKTRVVCTGDSFTLGVGVGDGETWCAQLESLAPDLEAVNMAQAGYGVDQAYLWYKRDGAPLEPRLHVLGLVSVDLDRMMTDGFVGFPKPYLELENGALVTRNVPVPRGPYVFPWLTLLAPRLDELRLVAFARRLARAGERAAAPRGPRTPMNDLLFAAAEELRRLSEARGAHFAVAYLPTIADCAPNPAFDDWRARLRAEFERRGFAYLDLVPAFRAQPPDARDRLFLPATVMGRHYSAEGHRLVARLVYERVQPLLASSPGGP